MTTVDCQREKGEGEREREGEGKKYPIHQKKETLLNPDEFRIILGQCLEISISLPSNRLNSARVCWKRAVEVEESNLGRASFFFFFARQFFCLEQKCGAITRGNRDICSPSSPHLPQFSVLHPALLS